MSDQAPQPPQPPSTFSAADFDTLIGKMAAKLGLPVKATTKLVTSWRWTAATAPFDGAEKGLRDNLAALVTFTNAIRNATDKAAVELLDHETRITRLEEAPAPRPFP